MTTTTVNGAALRLNNGKLEYQCRCGNLLKWIVTFRDRYYDGWTGDTLWEPSLEAAREYVGLNAGSYRNLSRDPITPDYDSNPIAAGWSPADCDAAFAWYGNILHLSERFAAKERAAG